MRRDMRDFARPGAFDLALCMYTSFGYFEDRGDDLRVLRQVFESLRPGGVFVIETVGKEPVAGVFSPVATESFPDGTLLVHTREVADSWTRLRNQWTLVRRGRAKTYSFEHTIYSGQELRDLYERAGFEDVKLYGGVDGREYGREGLYLVIVGRRPASHRHRRFK